MFRKAMGGIEVPPNGELDNRFGTYCGTLARVVSLVTIGAGGAFARIALEGMFNDLLKITLGKR